MAKTNKNYYDILGVDNTATPEKIKKAYKKLSLKYHPDRQAGKSDAEKKDAEEKFIEINEAYQVLSDETKRQNYDNFGDPDININPNDIFGGFHHPFGGFGMGNHGGFRQKAENIPGKDIRVTIPLTIEEIFSGTTKKIKYEKNIRCATCHGDGGTGLKTCPTCRGTGMEQHVEYTPFGIVSQQTTCRKCHGKGTTVDKICPSCNGSGFIKSTDIAEIEIPAGLSADQYLIVNGKGSESKSTKGINGNLIVLISHNYDTEKYIVEGNDVIEIIHLPYYDLLLGTEYLHTFPNGKTKKIQITPCSQDGKIIRLYKEGINGNGDYFLQLKYQTPEQLSDTERKALETIKVEKAKEKL